MTLEIKDIHIVLGIGAIVVVAGGTVLGTIKFVIPNLKDGLGKLSRKLEVLEDKMVALVDKDSFDKEITRLDEACSDHRAGCQALLCGRIDDVRGDLRVMDDKRENAKGEAVPREDFDQYKKEMKALVGQVQSELKGQSTLLTRLDERVLLLLSANGVNAKKNT